MRIFVPVVVGLVATASGLATGQRPDADPNIEAVRSLIEVGRYGEAEAQAARLFDAQRATAGDELVDLRPADLLVEALTRNGRGAEPRTREIAERVIQVRIGRFDPEDPSLVPTLRNLGEVLFQAGEYRLAVVRFEEALRISERNGANTSEVAECLDNLARALMRIERSDEARLFVDRALAIKQQIYGWDDVAIARTLEIRSMIWQRKGEFSRSRSDLERAVAIREASHSKHPDTALGLMLFGLQLRYEGNLVQARIFLTRAASLAESSLRPDHPDLAIYLRFLAWVLSDVGDLAGARVLQERGLAISERSLGSEHPLVADQLNDLANTLLLQGEYSPARNFYEHALKTYERKLGPDDFYVTTVVYNLAILNASLGDSVEARRLLRRALSTWERTVGVGHPAVSRALWEFAQVLAGEGADREALSLYERALTIRERVLGANHPNVAQTLSSLSESLARLRQFRRASELSARALRIWEQSGMTHAGGMADSLRIDGTVQTHLGNYVGARLAYERALAIQLPVLGRSHPGIAQIDVALAGVLANLDRRNEAFAKALQGEEIGRGHLRLTLGYLPERQALGYGVKRPKGLDVALSLISDGDSTTEAFDAVIRGRALILDELGFRRRSLGDPAADTIGPLRTALTSARQRLANLVIRGPDERRPEQYAALVDGARREAEQAERALAEKSAKFRAELERSEVGLTDVRVALTDDRALVALIRYDRTIVDDPSARSTAGAATVSTPLKKPVPSYVAFVLRANRSDVSVVPLGPASVIDVLVARWRAETTGIVGAPSPADAEESYRAAGVALRRRVWDPLREHLTGATTVFVVPDGTLNLVSFAALPVGSSKYLIDEGPVIHYLSAERDLVASASPLAVTRGLLAVGGAAFNDATLFARTSKPAPAPLAGDIKHEHRLPRCGLVSIRYAAGRLWHVANDAVHATRRHKPRSARRSRPLAGLLSAGP